MADRKVTVQLDLSMGSAGDRVLKDLEKSVRGAASAFGDVKRASAGLKGDVSSLSVLRNLGLGGISGEVGRFQGVGQGLSELGFTGVGGAITRRAGALGAAKSAIDTAGGVAGILHDPYLTGAQRGRALVGLDPTGIAPWVQQKFDQFSGRAAAMEQTEVRQQLRGLENQFRSQQLGIGLRLGPQQAFAEERARQAASAKTISVGPIDRTTFRGELEFRERSKMVPLERELAKAQREEAAAVKERLSAQGAETNIVKNLNSLTKERARLARDAEQAGGSGPERQERLRQLANAEEALQRAAEQRREAAEVVQSARRKEAESRAATGERQAAITEGRAEIIAGRAERATGLARTLGAMNPFERAEALQSAKLALRYDPSLLPPDMLARAQQVLPGTVGKRIEEFGARSSQFAEFQRLAPDEIAGTPEQLRRQAEGLTTQADRQRTANEAAITRAFADAGREMARISTDAARAMIDSYKREVEDKLRIGRGQQ